MKRRAFLAAGASAITLSSVSTGCVDSLNELSGSCGPGEDTIEDAYQYQAIEITNPDSSNQEMAPWTEEYVDYESNEVTIEGEVIDRDRLDSDSGEFYVIDDGTGRAGLHNGGLSEFVTLIQLNEDISYEPDETQAEEGECVRVTGVPSVTEDPNENQVQFAYPRIIEIVG